MDKVQNIVSQLKEIKLKHGYSNQEIADMTGVPKSTVDRVFGNRLYNFTYETIQPIVKTLLDMDDLCKDDPLLNENEMVDLLRNVIAAKNSEIDRLRDDLELEKHSKRTDTADLRQQHNADIEDLRSRHRSDIQELKEELALERKSKWRVSVALFVMITIVALFVLADFFLANIGWLHV